MNLLPHALGISLIALGHDDTSFLLKMGDASTLLERATLTVDDTGVSLHAKSKSPIGHAVAPIDEMVVTVFIGHDWETWTVTLSGDLDVKGLRLQHAFATIDEDGYTVRGAASSSRQVELEMNPRGDVLMSFF